MGERGGTTVVRRPERPRSSAARESGPVQRPEQRSERPARTADEARRSGRFDLSAWVFGMVERADDTPAEPFRQGLVRRESALPPPRRQRPAEPTPRALRRPEPTPMALRRPEPTPATLRRPEPAPPPTPAPRRPEPTPATLRRPEPRNQFDLASWVFGLVPSKEPDAPPAPAPRRTARPPARKPLTMPDLFEGAPVPPCLDDD